jgi:diaminopimelate decarboxylase
VLRPSLYGAQHPLIIVPKDKSRAGQLDNYVVVGHCCESGDLLTPAAGTSLSNSKALLFGLKKM